jgi:hypothetical protein
VLWEERQKAAEEAEVKKQLREARRALKAQQKSDADVEEEQRRLDREALAKAQSTPWSKMGMTEDEYRAVGWLVGG